MGPLDIATGIWLDRLLNDKKDEQKQSNQEIYVDVSSDYKEYMARIERNYKWLDDTLESPRMFGYLLETDRMGYYKAIIRAKDMFRGLYGEREYKNMLIGDKNINPELIRMIEEFYYKEINPSAKIYDLKLARYNALRDKLIRMFENHQDVLTEEYANNVFGISREEMFCKIKTNELVFAYATKSNTWGVAKPEDYFQYVKEGRAEVSYPLEDERD